MSQGPQPLAHGTLDVTPLDHVVISLHRKRLSGTLAIWPEVEGVAGQDRVLFKHGQPVAAKLIEPASALDRGLMPLFRRTSAAYAFYGEDLLGDRSALVTGSVDANALVLAAMRGGMRETVVDRVLARYDGAAVRLVTGYDVTRLAPLPKEQAFIELLRADPAGVDTLVARSGEPKVARRVLYTLAITHGIEPYAVPVETHELPTLDLEPKAVVSVDVPRSDALDGVLGARSSYTEVRPSDFPFPDAKLSGARASTPPAEPRSPTAQKRPSGGAPRPDPRRAAKAPEPPPPPPEGLDPALAKRWQDIAARFVAIDGQNYFQMLDVSEICTPDEVRDAYFASVKLWHPDRIPEGLEALRPFVERIFHHLTSARDALADEAGRVAYLKSVAQGGGRPADDRKVEAILAASQEYEKAQILANRAKWDEVLEHLAICIELDPESPDYTALRAWAVLQRAPLDAKPEAKEALTLAESAIRLAKGAHHERAVFTKGVALQRLGRGDDANECFRKVMERNPKHLDAAREVRLFEMRARNSMAPKPDAAAKPDPGSGLLSKLFGGKKP